MELSSQPGMCDVQSILDAAEHGCAVPPQSKRLEPPIFARPKWKAKTYFGGLLCLVEMGKENITFLSL